MYIGKGYLELSKKGAPENIEVAIHHLKYSLNYCSREIHPAVYMRAQYRLSIAYSKRQIGDQKDNLECAESSCAEAFHVANSEGESLSAQREIQSFLELIRIKKELEEDSLSLESSVQARFIQVMRM